ncbi:MAG: hypothetical protein EPN85_04835 [Bacteroidetes bacterium]|nr:MAG: hypothetical protein EPN85_04835 [Bacteroidota bacterium]
METSPFTPGQSARPTFLKVVCILTFIGAGLVLLFSSFGINSAFFQSPDEKATIREMTVEQVLKMNSDADEEYVYEVLLENEKYEQSNLINGMVFSLLSLIGALLMWRMKKTGFYLYVAGELVTYLVTLVLHGADGFKAGINAASIWSSSYESMAAASIVLIAAFDIAFIAMYAMNLKHMK